MNRTVWIIWYELYQKKNSLDIQLVGRSRPKRSLHKSIYEVIAHHPNPYFQHEPHHRSDYISPKYLLQAFEGLFKTRRSHERCPWSPDWHVNINRFVMIAAKVKYRLILYVNRNNKIHSKPRIVKLISIFNCFIWSISYSTCIWCIWIIWYGP